jgi:hypothetical protein
VAFFTGNEVQESIPLAKFRVPETDYGDIVFARQPLQNVKIANLATTIQGLGEVARQVKD